MSASLSVTGGARIGSVNATWPLAKLSASANRLTVSSPLMGRYDFDPSDVVSLSRYGSIPVLGSGIRIVHTNSKYPENIIFWCFGSPQRLIDRIRGLGFRPGARQSSAPTRDGIAFRWSFVFLVVLIWNALFLLDWFILRRGSPGPAPELILVPALLFLSAWTLRVSPRFQAFALKPGRSVEEVLPVLRLVLFVSGFMLVAFAVQGVSFTALR